MASSSPEQGRSLPPSPGPAPGHTSAERAATPVLTASAGTEDSPSSFRAGRGLRGEVKRISHYAFCCLKSHLLPLKAGAKESPNVLLTSRRRNHSLKPRTTHYQPVLLGPNKALVSPHNYCCKHPLKNTVLKRKKKKDTHTHTQTRAALGLLVHIIQARRALPTGRKRLKT